MLLVNRVFVLLALTSVAYSKIKTQVCRTPQCQALSALITNNMDLTADPCEDFVQFACGNFPANTQYDPDSMTFSRYSSKMELMQNGIGAVTSSLEKKVFELLVVNRTIDSDDPDVSSMFRLTRSFYRSCVSWGFSRMQCFQSDCDLMASQKFFNGALTHLLDTINERKVNGSFERALARMIGMQFWQLFEIWPVRSMTEDTLQLKMNRVRLTTDVQFYSVNKSAKRYLDFFQQLEASFKLSPDSLTEDKFNNSLQELVKKAAEHRDGSFSTSLRVCARGKLDTSYFTVADLDFLTSCATNSSFLWSQFFQEFFQSDVQDSISMEVYHGGRLDEIGKIISIVDNFKSRSFWTRDGKLSPHFSFLAIDWLFSFASYFPQNLLTEWRNGDAYRPTVNIPTLKYSPVKDCIQATKRLLGPVAELMYQKSHHADSFDDVRELVESVQNATVQSVREQTWITPESKEAIVEKILAQKSLIGFYELSTQELKDSYGQTIKDFNAGGYSSNSEDFGMMFSLASCANAGLMRRWLIGDSPSSVLSEMGGLIVNAFNFGRQNQIVFPMGILSPFLYHKSYPAYMNLGGIGVIVGHEIGHGFDNTGHELDKKGASGHFWGNITEIEYLKRMKCVQSKFSKYEVVPGRAHKSESTLGNDISDLMGIRSAFRALKSLGERGRLLSLPNLPNSLSPERLFFVQAAQAWCTKAEPQTLIKVFAESPSSHSPPHIRIRGMMEHSSDFARVFQCKANQTMNPTEKCEFW